MAAATALALVAAGSALYGAIKKPKAEAAAPVAPALPPAPDPADDTKAIEAALHKRMRRTASAPGRAATLLTGPSGLSTPAPTERKTLLGA